MGVFVRAIVTGFGFSLGKALFDRVSTELGLKTSTDTAPDPTVDDTDDGEVEE